MSQVKLSDIAKKLKVSVSLVSLVLSGKAKANRISDEVIEKVLKAANEMGYEPNQLARGLRTGRTNTIGLIVADISNPFFAKMARNLENEAWKQGYQVIFGSSDENPDKFSKLLQAFLSRKVDGLIISPTAGTEPYIKNLQQRKVPFVLIDRYFPELETNYVGIDNVAASRSLTRILLENGRKKIGVLSVSRGLTHMQERLDGYRKALQEEGFTPSEDLIATIDYENFQESLHEAIDCLLAAPLSVDALYFTTNRLGTYGLQYLLEKGVRVPEELAVVGFDNPVAYSLFSPPITCVEQPIDQICRVALEDLLQSLKKKETIGKHLLNAKLILRQSV